MNYLAFLKLLAANAALLPRLFELTREIFAAPTFGEKWAVIVKIGDLLLPAIEQMPGGVVSKDVATMSDDELRDYNAEVSDVERDVLAKLQEQAAADASLHAQAWDGARLKKIWGVVEYLLPLLLSMKG